MTQKVATCHLQYGLRYCQSRLSLCESSVIFPFPVILSGGEIERVGGQTVLQLILSIIEHPLPQVDVILGEVA
jgi:hypothetical protein